MRSQTASMKVMVAGAGIAGLSSAIAMAKAGCDVSVAERASELREIGAALSVWPNALAALDHLGVGEQVRSVAVEAPTASIRSRAGRTIVGFDTEAMRIALGGLPVVVLRRALQAILSEECARLGINILLDRPVEELGRDGPGVTVKTGGGEMTVDAVIGADGINSKVRSAVTSEESLRDCDRIAWRALIPDPDGLVAQTWLSVGVGSQLIASPAPEGLAYWAADTPGSDSPQSNGADPKAILLGRFGGWHPPISEIIHATPPDSLIVNRIFDRRQPRTLRRGPILLVGDAAHAMTPDLGQGACQALEDAAILLACASKRPDAHPADLFESFEQVRLPRVRQIVRDSYRIGRLATAPWRLAASARDLLTRLVPESVNNGRLAVYASAGAFDKQLALATA